VLISSLLQFISNLCYGTGKLKMMLAKENMSEFTSTLREVLDQINVELKPDDEMTDVNDDESNLEEIISDA